MSQIAEEYSRLLDHQQSTTLTLKQKLNMWVLLRLGTFLGFCGGLISWFNWGSTFFIIFAFGSLALFLFSVVRHKHTQEAFIFSKACEKTLHSEMNGLKGNWEIIFSSPQADPNHPYANDLDIVGPFSLFDKLNRCRTRIGRKLLRDRLLGIPHDRDSIQSHQKLAAQIASMHNWRIRVGAAGDELVAEGDGSEQIESISKWATQNSALFGGQVFKVVSWLVPIWSLSLLVLIATSVLPLVLGGTLMLLPLIPIALKLRESSALNATLTVQIASLRKFDKLLSEICEVTNIQPELDKEIQPLRDASIAFDKLARILEKFDQRNNLIVVVITNISYWAEVRNVRSLNAWRAEYGKHIAEWLSQIGRIEMLISFGTWAAHVDPNHCWPEWVASTTFETEDLRHPLMNPENAVGNPVHLTGETQIRIITGANMAGKSTYLRTVGINYVLAHLGLPILAGKARFSSAKLLTSMRTTDSLNDGTSYFLAELKRLAFIVHDLQSENRHALILLDEILKGTNSRDKAAGSRAFVEQLVRIKVSVLVATHDLSLCDLEDSYPSVISNQHFAALIEGDDLTFNYKIQEGICDTMNATFLMKKLGIISKDLS